MHNESRNLEFWKFSKSIWNSFYVADCDPETWGMVTNDVGDYYYQMMATEFPEFRYCDNGKWKARIYATQKYPDWVNKVRKDGSLTRNPGINRAIHLPFPLSVC